jgi:hypothetical protein
VRPVDPLRWDDYALAVLLLLVAVPRLVLALASGQPLGAEGTLSMVFIALALLVVFSRRR